MLRGERPVLELSTRLGVYHTDASENDAMRALRGILPWAEAGHCDVASEQLGEELVGVRREELGAVVSPEALDAGFAVDFGEVLSVVGEEGLHALRELLGGVVAHEVQVEAPRRVVQESDPPDVAVRLRHGKRARVGPDEIAELLRLGLGNAVDVGLLPGR